MSFLVDLFKKKDAAYFAERARKSLERELWVEARDLAEDGLSKNPSEALEKELKQVEREARRAICDMNREEAGYSAEAGELERAIDLLNVAMDNAPSESVKRDIRREQDRLERRSVSRDRSRVAKELGRRHTVGDQDVKRLIEDEAPAEHDVADLFEVYIAGLVPQAAEHYRRLGPDFMNAYVAMNQGDIKHALTLMRKVDADDNSRPYLNFERAHVALQLGMAREALTLLEPTIAVHGYGPIYLSGMPHVALLESEARLALEDLTGALAAVQKGRELDPENPQLNVMEVQMLLRSKELDRAAQLIERHLKTNSKYRDMYLLYYQLEMSRENPTRAASLLEQGMNTCCASGKCGPQDKEIPRTLVSHYLRREEQPKRIEDLLQTLFRSQGGEGEWIDFFLRARFYKWQGDDERGKRNWEAAIDAIPEDHPQLNDVRALYAS